MAITNEYPLISSNMKLNLGPYGTIDPYNATLQNNGALNPLGSLAWLPSPSNSGWTVGGGSPLASQTGYASGLLIKYVRYNSSGAASVSGITGPGIVYYIDETFTTVSGTFSEGLPAGTGNASSVAGWMLPNAGTGTYGLGSAFTTANLNGNFIWIALAGFIPQAYVGAVGAIGNPLSGAAGTCVVAVTTGVLRVTAYVLTTPASSLADLLVTQPFV